MACICDIPDGCGGTGNLYCEGCGGDLCVCPGGGDLGPCPGCDDCDGEAEDWDDYDDYQIPEDE
jgi:hypothetical protein